MKKNKPLLVRARGIVMIDALVAVVIFSIGIVGMITLQGQAVNLASNAKYRTDAAMLADQVIAQMWVSNTSATAGALANNFNSPDGASYKAWATNVTKLTATGGLPGAAANPPTVVVDGNNQVTVTIYWKPPSDPADQAPHQYVAQTQIQP